MTADDPNYEDPMAIADEIRSYINHPVEKIADRQEAIKAAMAITNHELDAVIIAGKGANELNIIISSEFTRSWKAKGFGILDLVIRLATVEIMVLILRLALSIQKSGPCHC